MGTTGPLASSLVPMASDRWLPVRAGQVRLADAFFAGRNANTVRAYRQDLEDFKRFVDARDSNEAAALLLAEGPGPANALALAYKDELMKRGLAPARWPSSSRPRCEGEEPVQSPKRIIIGLKTEVNLRGSRGSQRERQT